MLSEFLYSELLFYFITKINLRDKFVCKIKVIFFILILFYLYKSGRYLKFGEYNNCLIIYILMFRTRN